VSDDWRKRRYCGSPEVDAAAGVESTEGFLPRECCDSCHDDYLEGYDDPNDVDLPGGLVGLVCCRMWSLIEERGTGDQAP